VPAGEQETARSSVTEPRAVSRPESELLDRIAELARCELEVGELPLPDGSVVRVVSLAEVEEWLHGLAARARGGTHL
jgi:hypothetical protein